MKKNNKPVVPTVAIQIKINVLSDGSMRVFGFPKHHDTASQMLEMATRVVNKYFIQKAKEGKLDDDNQETESKILMPDKRIITPVGRG